MRSTGRSGSGGLWIGPPWEQPRPGELAVVIDPGRAFGTGAHPTTRLCVELLARSERGSLLDVGCGSGVLSIAAARLGFGPILAVDNDPVAVETTVANAAVNGVALEACCSTASPDELPRADVAVANIAARPGGERSSPRLDAGAAITSGYLDDRSPCRARAGSTSTALRARRLGRRPLRAGAVGRLAALAEPCARAERLRSRGVATFTTRFLGCKVSFADEQAIRERLLADGHTRGERRRQTSRSSTRAASRTRPSRSRGRPPSRAARTPRARLRDGMRRATSRAAPSTGCRTTCASSPGASEEVADAVAGDVGAIGCVQAEHRLDRVRAFVKIQDGCSFSCAFCVIPLVRGATRSRSADAVLAEIRRRVAQGHREIVLTGVNLGCFRDREAALTPRRG